MLTSMTFIVATVVSGIILHLTPYAIRFFMERIPRSFGKIIWYVTLVILGCCVTGIIGSLSPEAYKTVICLSSFGLICLMTALIVSLLFIGVLTEKWERKSEE